MLKQAIQTAFDLAEKQYESGHLTGEQIKTHLSQAMSFLDTDAAMLMNGKQVSAGTFKIKSFPLDKLNIITEPVFQNVSALAPLVETDILGEDGDKEPLNVDELVSMSPKKALEVYTIEAIDKLIKVFKVEIKDGLNDIQKTAALQSALKKKK